MILKCTQKFFIQTTPLSQLLVVLMNMILQQAKQLFLKYCFPNSVSSALYICLPPLYVKHAVLYGPLVDLKENSVMLRDVGMQFLCFLNTNLSLNCMFINVSNCNLSSGKRYS